MTYLAAMLDPKYRAGHPEAVRYKIGFEQIRKRPKQDQISTLEKRILFVFWFGVPALAKGRDPGRPFWVFFLAALEPEYRLEPPKASFPFQARVQAIEGGRGRRPDSGLEMRDKVIVWFAQKEREKFGGKFWYKNGIPNVAKELGLSVSTVRNVYDSWAKPKPPK
jgi:hypothetical protein